MKSYTDIGLTQNLQKEDSLAANPSIIKSGYDIQSETPRGAFGGVQLNSNQLMTTSNIATAGPITLGSSGSGTEQVRVTSTLSSRRGSFDKLFGIQEFSFYQGTTITGTADIRGTGFSGTYVHWEVEGDQLSFQESNRFNLVGKTAAKNTTASTVQVKFRNQWRALQPPGGAKEA